MYEAISANKQRTLWLFLAFMALVILLGFILARLFELPSLLWWAVGISLVGSWLSYFYSDRVALAASGARLVKKGEFPELVRVVENLSIASGLPTPRLYVIHDSAPNALATGRDPRHAAIAVTTGLLQLLTKKELEGVVAHELAHIQNYDILVATLAVTLAGAVALVSDWFLRINFWRGRRDREGGSFFAMIGLLLALLAPLFATLLQLAISRRCEFLADASGAFLTRYPSGLISALEKLARSPHRLKRVSKATAHLFIVNPLQRWGERLAVLWSTHPPIQQRIAALRKLEI